MRSGSQPRLYVLAAGGVENARLLLASRATYPAGLGNGHDLVGRFFMEHVVVNAGTIVPRSPDLFAHARAYTRRRIAGGDTLAGLQLREAVVREEGLTGVVLSPFVGREALFSRGFVSLATMLAQLRGRRPAPRAAQPPAQRRRGAPGGDREGA